MSTHKIAHSGFFCPVTQTVPTVHRAGIWAVHIDTDTSKFVLSHIPTGRRAETCDTLPEVIEIADALHSAYPDFGTNVEWAKSPTFDSGVLEGMRKIINTIANKHKVQTQ
jgi:hypothetical protein